MLKLCKKTNVTILLQYLSGSSRGCGSSVEKFKFERRTNTASGGFCKAVQCFSQQGWTLIAIIQFPVGFPETVFFSQGANTWLSHPPHPFLDSCVSSTILLSFRPSSVILLWSLRVLLGSFNSDIRCQIFLSLPSLCWNHSTLSFCLIGQFLHPYLCQHPLGLFSPQPSLSSHYTLNQVSMRSRLQSFLFAAKHQPWHEVYPHPYICPCLTDTACSIHNDVTFLILIKLLT